LEKFASNSVGAIEPLRDDRGSLLWEKHALKQYATIWKGSISFGLVYIPWRFSATAKKSLAFDSFCLAISVQSDTKRWRKPTLKKFQPTKS